MLFWMLTFSSTSISSATIVAFVIARVPEMRTFPRCLKVCPGSALQRSTVSRVATLVSGILATSCNHFFTGRGSKAMLSHKWELESRTSPSWSARAPAIMLYVVLREHVPRCTATFPSIRALPASEIPAEVSRMVSAGQFRLSRTRRNHDESVMGIAPFRSDAESMTQPKAPVCVAREKYSRAGSGAPCLRSTGLQGRESSLAFHVA